MKVLMFGRGAISTLYGWALEKAGNRVDFYVRPGRAAEYGPSVDVAIRDGRTDSSGIPVDERWPITMREELDSGHDYDLIIVSVNHDQLSEVIDFLRTRIGTATVLMFNNIWVDPSVAIAALPSEQVVWGFPGGGGGFAGNTLKGGFVKTVFMGKYGDANRAARYRAVRALFREAGFSVSESRDFRNWLWIHFALAAGLAVQALRAGGHSAVLGSRAQLKESVLHVREIIPLLKAKGGRLGATGIALSCLPAGPLAFIAQKFLGRENLLSFIMKQTEATDHTNYALTSIYPRDVLTEARRLGVPVPRLAAAEPVFA